MLPSSIPTLPAVRAPLHWPSRRAHGIATAEGMNAKLALARLHQELGTRTADPAHLETARLLFAQLWHSQGAGLATASHD